MSERAKPLVSVVTPFYNTAPYLAECIESVLAQDYPHWEYVLVDNASTDDSAAIARGYAKQEPRIRLLRNETHVAQVPNYNRGLAAISDRSEYTKVVEADNSIAPACLSQMVALAEAHPRVGIVGAYCITERDLRFRGLPRDVTVVSGRDIARKHLIDGAYLFGAPTTVLMRSAAVRARSPFYREDTWLIEDLSACYELFRDWDFGFVHQVLTFVRTENEGSIQSGRWTFEAMALDRLAVVARHGKDFLGADELPRVLARTRSAYYARLAEAALRGTSAAFWDYHRRGLAEFGFRLERARLAWHIWREFLSAVANPGRSVSAMFHAARHGQARRS